jgi:transcription elongation GreA/GreB family factor
MNLDEYEDNIIDQKSHKEQENRVSGIKNKNACLSREYLLNKKVKLLDFEMNEVIVITIVEEKDKDISSDKVSIESPLGKALCKVCVGTKFGFVQGKKIIKYNLKKVF